MPAPPAAPAVDVLVPTYRRPAALAVTLAALAGSELRPARVVVSDQTEDGPGSIGSGEVQTVVRVLQHRGVEVELHRHLPRRGLAEHRQFLLDQARSPRALFLDDDVVLEPDALGTMVRTLTAEGCGFVGMPLIGLSYRDDVRPSEQPFEPWDGPVRPEVVEPLGPTWPRHSLHNAANVLHVQQRLGLTADAPRTYKVAWVGGCVLYDVEKLRTCGGFDFWRELPPDHCGEDVVAQLRVMARFGGCGVLPSGAFHQELPTTVVDRTVDAPHVLDRTVTTTGPCAPPRPC